MKTLLSLSFIAYLLLFIGCSSSNKVHQYEYRQPSTSINSNIGYLKIYTDTFFEKGIYDEDIPYEVYKGYSIYTKNGDFVKDVEKSYQSPPQVKLEEGDYVVIAELHNNVVQSFAVSIEKGKITVIDKNMINKHL